MCVSLKQLNQLLAIIASVYQWIIIELILTFSAYPYRHTKGLNIKKGVFELVLKSLFCVSYIYNMAKGLKSKFIFEK